MFKIGKLFSEKKTPDRQISRSADSPDRFEDLYRFFSRDKSLTIFDVGANVGLISEKFRAIYPNSSIHAFEPTPEAFKRLEWRFREDSSFFGNNVAVSNEMSSATFYVNKEFNKVNSLLPRNKEMQIMHGLASVDHSISVKTLTLDHYCTEKGINHINILKMDIQGGEMLALSGSQKLLESGQIDVILSETLFESLYDGCPLFHDLSVFLAKYGYKLYNLYDLHQGKNGQLTWGDSIFFHPKLFR